MHAHHGVRLLARGEERIPLARVDRRQPELGRDLAEAHRVHTARRVAAHLVGRELGVPERDDDQRDELAVAVAAPFLDHPVVVREHARVRELRSLASRKVWPQKRGNVGKHSDASTQFISMSSTRAFGLVAARPHLVVGDRRHRHVVTVEADRRDVPLVDVDEVLVDPAVGLRSALVEGLLVRAAADVLHGADAAPFDLRAAIAESFGQPRLPQVRGLDDVVVDADDLGQFPRHTRSPGRI